MGGQNKVACTPAGCSQRWERASINILPGDLLSSPPQPPLPPHRPERGGSARHGEEGWQARMEAEAVPSPLMFPSSGTGSSGEDRPWCARQRASSPGQSGTAGRSRCFFPNFCSICSLSRTFKNESAHPE